jgi:hypothetical protein
MLDFNARSAEPWWRTEDETEKAPAMAQSREEFLYRQNVTNFTRLLRDAPDEAMRTTLLRLLAEEAAKAKEAGWAPLFD